MSDMYLIFSCHFQHLNVSESSRIEQYLHESKGYPTSENNGYTVGKKWMDITISMWKQDIKQGILSINELYNDPKFPDWWLDKILRL